MKELSLKSRVSKAFIPITTKSDPSKRPVPNVLGRDFDAARPNQKWVTDVTYLPPLQVWVYWAVVVDLFRRKMVGWLMVTRWLPRWRVLPYVKRSNADGLSVESYCIPVIEVASTRVRVTNRRSRRWPSTVR